MRRAPPTTSVDYHSPDWTEPNPLAVGTFCDCGTRLEILHGELRKCPMGCTEPEAAA